jgi:predicted enzyme related to lactoylglutathione lyase
MKPQPLICVADVEASSRWYQDLLGCQSAHGGAEYERLLSDGVLVLQLHRWDVEHHHGRLGDPSVQPGNGVLLWFEVEDFDAALARADALNAEVVMPRHRNPSDGNGGPTTGNSGCATLTATPSCSRVRMVQRTVIGGPCRRR